MLPTDIRRLERQTAEDFAHARARIDIDSRCYRQRDVDVSRTRFQPHIADDSIAN